MEKLFEALQASGQYSKSFSDFQSQFGSPEGQEKLYGALKESGSYTKSMNDFTSQFFNTAEPVKTILGYVVLFLLVVIRIFLSEFAIVLLLYYKIFLQSEL